MRDYLSTGTTLPLFVLITSHVTSDGPISELYGKVGYNLED
jgi:hypothetical protein